EQHVVEVPQNSVTPAASAESAKDIKREDEPRLNISEYLPRGKKSLAVPSGLKVDIIIPVYRGFEETRRCLTSVLADSERPAGVIRVIDDCSPDPELSQWLSTLADSGVIELSRNDRNIGFVKTVNKGMVGAGRHDVVLLNSDTEVPQGFVRRLAG